MRELQTNEVGQVTGGLGLACAAGRAVLAGGRAAAAWMGRNKVKTAAISVGGGVAEGAVEEAVSGGGN